MDSTTLLGLLLEQGHVVYPVSFTYGSKHNKYENQASVNVRQYFWNRFPDTLMPLIGIDLSSAFSVFKSDLLLSGGEIPEGHYESENMKATVVPGRNTIFISFMLGIAESINSDFICLGVHSGDHHIYPDCRLQYINHMRAVVKEATEGKVDLIAPLLQDDKASIIQQGIKIEVPYYLTRTCYKDQPLSCGKCGSCVERLEAFEKNGITDPIKYAD